MIKPNKYQDIMIKDDGSGYYIISYFNSRKEKPCIPEDADMTITTEYDDNDRIVGNVRGYTPGASIIPEKLPWLNNKGGK